MENRRTTDIINQQQRAKSFGCGYMEFVIENDGVDDRIVVSSINLKSAKHKTLYVKDDGLVFDAEKLCREGMIEVDVLYTTPKAFENMNKQVFLLNWFECFVDDKPHLERKCILGLWSDLLKKGLKGDVLVCVKQVIFETNEATEEAFQYNDTGLLMLTYPLNEKEMNTKLQQVLSDELIKKRYYYGLILYYMYKHSEAVYKPLFKADIQNIVQRLMDNPECDLSEEVQRYSLQLLDVGEGEIDFLIYLSKEHMLSNTTPITNVSSHLGVDWGLNPNEMKFYLVDTPLCRESKQRWVNFQVDCGTVFPLLQMREIGLTDYRRAINMVEQLKVDVGKEENKYQPPKNMASWAEAQWLLLFEFSKRWNEGKGEYFWILDEQHQNYLSEFADEVLRGIELVYLTTEYDIAKDITRNKLIHWLNRLNMIQPPHLPIKQLNKYLKMQFTERVKLLKFVMSVSQTIRRNRENLKLVSVPTSAGDGSWELKPSEDTHTVQERLKGFGEFIGDLLRFSVTLNIVLENSSEKKSNHWDAKLLIFALHQLKESVRDIVKLNNDIQMEGVQCPKSVFDLRSNSKTHYWKEQGELFWNLYSDDFLKGDKEAKRLQLYPQINVFVPETCNWLLGASLEEKIRREIYFLAQQVSVDGYTLKFVNIEQYFYEVYNALLAGKEYKGLSKKKLEGCMITLTFKGEH